MPAQTDLTAIASWLRRKYRDPFIAAYNGRTRLHALIARGVTPVSGEHWEVPIDPRPNPSAGSIAESDNVPAGASVTKNKAVFNPTYLHAAEKINVSAIKAAMRGGAAAENLVSHAMMKLNEAMRLMVNWQLHGDGSQLLATCASASDATTIVVDRVTRHMIVGKPVDVLVKSSGLVGSGKLDTTIASVNAATKTITIADNLGTYGDIDSTYVICPKNGWNDAAWGFDAAISQSNPGFGVHANYGEINRSTAGNEWWKSQRVHNSGTNINFDPDMLEEASDLVEVAGGSLSHFICRHAVRRNINAYRRVDQRFSTQDNELGVPELHFNGIPIMVDEDVKPNAIWGIQVADFEFLEESPIEFIDEDGAMLRYLGTGGTGPDQFEIRARHHWQLACSSPNRQVVIEDVIEGARV